MFTLFWLKIFSFLSVFSKLRYLIQMIFEIIGGIQAFLIILLISFVAYG